MADVRIVGCADPWLFGLDADGSPVVWQEGEVPAPADPLDDYSVWHVGIAGFDRFWIDSRGERRE